MLLRTELWLLLVKNMVTHMFYLKINVQSHIKTMKTLKQFWVKKTKLIYLKIQSWYTSLKSLRYIKNREVDIPPFWSWYTHFFFWYTGISKKKMGISFATFSHWAQAWIFGDNNEVILKITNKPFFDLMMCAWCGIVVFLCVVYESKSAHGLKWLESGFFLYIANI